MTTSRIIIVDGYSFVFRAYHSMPALSRPVDGTPVGAVYGFTSMLMRMILDIEHTHIVVVFDAGSKGFRHDIYSEYKANRPPVPEDLIPQFPLVREAAKALNIEILEKERYEADDIIATLAHEARAKKEEVLIVSSDKDLMQLVNHHTTMYDAMRSKYIGIKEVEEKFGVKPEKIRDLLALVGDTSDNVPGVPGIGPKTAAELLNKFETVEGIFENLDKIKQPKRKSSLEDNRQKVKLSQRLVSLVSDLSLNIKLDDLEKKKIDEQKIVEFLHQQGFKTLISRVKKNFSMESNNISDGVNASKIKDNSVDVPKFKNENIQIIQSQKDFKKIYDKAVCCGKISFHIQTNFVNRESIESLQDVHSIGISIGSKYFYHISMTQVDKEQPSLLNLSMTQDKDFTFYEFVTNINAVLEDKSILKIFYDSKMFLNLLDNSEFKVSKDFMKLADDIMMMSYDIGSGKYDTSLGSLVDFYIPEQASKFDLIEGGGIVKSRNRFNALSKIETSTYVLKKAYIIEYLHALLERELFVSKQNVFYQRIDKKLPCVIRKMELYGVKVDPKKLLDLSEEVDKKLKVISQNIYKLAGVEFNIASPKQLSEVLFGSMGIAPPKKSKTGSYKTGSDILEGLQAQGHTIADLLLEWRKLNKIKTTYTTNLVSHIDKKSGRIHGKFLLSATATGRFSSVNPNLQNIPIRGEIANKIRSAFVAKDGYKILSADYSQIELRFAAHMGKVESLKKAFENNLDIHQATASEVFGVSLEKVTSDLRSKAKAINFGILYGMSGYGLAKNLGISKSDANEYINKYFVKYPEIKQYMSDAKQFASEHGYIETITKRRCYISGINSKDRNIRAFSERAAINFPLQGSNADIMRKAMIKIDESFSNTNLDCHLMLQVHDELVFEVKKSDIEKSTDLIKNIMENIVSLSIPTTVGIKIGDNWNK